MATAQEITSEIARLQDRLRIARNGLSSLDRNLQSNRAIIARYTEEVAAIPGQILALQVQLRSVLAPVSAGAIAGNANLAREENANPSLPTQPPQVITLDGRIKPAGSGPDGVGQISGTNAEPTPTQQNTPTVGTNDAVRPISQTQAINNQDGQLISVPNTKLQLQPPAARAQEQMQTLAAQFLQEQIRHLLNTVPVIKVMFTRQYRLSVFLSKVDLNNLSKVYCILNKLQIQHKQMLNKERL